MVSVEVKDPHRGYRKWMKAYCEICGKDKYYHPSQLDAHHIKEQSEFKKEGKKVEHRGNIATLCPNHHRDVTIGNMVITNRVMSTSNLILEYYYSNNPEKILYGY